MSKILAKKSQYRIALLGDFKEDGPRGIQIIGRKIHKGFIRNGHDVQPFSYRLHMNALAPLSGNKFFNKFAKKKADQLSCELLKNYRPDLVLVLAYRVINHSTIAKLKQILPNTVFAGWYPDALSGITQNSLKTNQYLDAFMATGAGPHLVDIAKKSNNIPVAFMPNPCDPDIEKPYEQCDIKTKLFFTGKLSHKSYPDDRNREELLKKLACTYGLTIHGNGKNKAILGMDYFSAISNSEIAISININNSIRMYHSDRLINYLGCGAFVLSSYSPDSDLLFQDKKHLRYFHSNDECIDLIKYYFDNENERRKIAAAGMAYAHEAFNCQRIARNIIDFLTTGTYDEPWRDIVG